MASDNQVDPKKIYREAALKKRQEEEKSDEILTITSAKNRLGIFFLIVIFLLALFWLFFGAIPVEVKGSGIFMKENGLFAIEAPLEGFVDEIFPTAGSFVKKGDPLFLISDTKTDISLDFANKQLASLEALYEKLIENYSNEEKQLREGINSQIASNQIKVEKMNKEIPLLEEDLEKRKNLLKEGLISATTLLNAEKILLQTKSALEATKSTIASLQADLVKTYRAEELKALEQRILKQKENRDLLSFSKRINQILTPFDAFILETLVHVGNPVTAGMNLMWIESASKEKNDVVVYGFVKADIGKRMTSGQNVYLQAMNINAQEFGFMIGKVVDISPTIAASEQIAVLIHDKTLEQYLTKGSPNNHLITIRPELDSSTISGFKWTSGKGIPFRIKTGTVCSISGVAYYERPIVTLFSLARLEAYLDKVQKWFNSLLKKEGS